jgi:hypothetical protein
MKSSYFAKPFMFGLFALVGGMFSACGKDSYSGSPAPQIEQVASAGGGGGGGGEVPGSYHATSVSALPTCNEARNAALAYVKDSKKFFVCNGNTWTEENIEFQNGNQVVGRWKFHVDSYAGEPNILSESAYGIAAVGGIEIVKYKNGLASYSFSGNIMDYTDNQYPTASTPAHDHAYSDQFSFSGVISDTTKEFSKITKFGYYQNMRIRVKIDVSNAIPTFKAVVDIDGNFSNNADTNFVLTPE